LASAHIAGASLLAASVVWGHIQVVWGHICSSMWYEEATNISGARTPCIAAFSTYRGS
jgi:hypothetical protein